MLTCVPHFCHDDDLNQFKGERCSFAIGSEEIAD